MCIMGSKTTLSEDYVHKVNYAKLRKSIVTMFVFEPDVRVAHSTFDLPRPTNVS